MSSRPAWLDALVGLDSAPLIYALERHPRYVDAVEAFLTALAESRLRAVTSTVTLVEEYEEFLGGTRNLVVRGLSVPVAREAARLRSAYNLRTPDAVQLATAISEGAAFFLTNDHDLTRVTALRVLVLDDLS